MSRVKPMAAPYTKQQLVKWARNVKSRDITGVICVSLDEIIDHCDGGGLEAFLDLLTERLVGDEILSDISYEVEGHDGDTLHVRVTGSLDYFEEYLEAGE